MSHRGDELTDGEKSVGCLILIAIFAGILIYTNLPSTKAKTEKANAEYYQREAKRRANWKYRNGMTVVLKPDGRKALIIDEDYGFNGDTQDGDFDIQVRVANNHKTWTNSNDYNDIVIKASQIERVAPQ
jgi:hypothetical protein